MAHGTEQSSEPIHQLQIIPLRRSDGVNIVARAAEISGSQSLQHSTGEIFDYSHLSEKVLYHKTLVPPDAQDVQWAQIPKSLWNEVQDGLDIPGRGRRTQSPPPGSAAKYYSASGPGDQLAREYRATIPRELTPEQAIDLGKRYTQTLSGQYRMPVQLAIHKPADNQSGYPIHMVSPTKELHDGQFARTTIWDLPKGGRFARENFAADTQYHQQSWTKMTNQALRDAGVERQHRERIAAESRESAQGGEAKNKTRAGWAERFRERAVGVWGKIASQASGSVHDRPVNKPEATQVKSNKHDGKYGL